MTGRAWRTKEGFFLERVVRPCPRWSPHPGGVPERPGGGTECPGLGQGGDWAQLGLVGLFQTQGFCTKVKTSLWRFRGSQDEIAVFRKTRQSFPPPS